jgi:hypothetical protein
MDWTQNLHYNRLCKFLTSKCDLDLGSRDTGVTHDVLSYYCLIIVTICAKYIQNPLIYEEVMYGTQNIPYNRLC